MLDEFLLTIIENMCVAWISTYNMCVLLSVSTNSYGSDKQHLPPLAAPSATRLVLAGHLLGEGDESHQQGHEHQRCTGPLHCQPRVISHMDWPHHTNSSTRPDDEIHQELTRLSFALKKKS